MADLADKIIMGVDIGYGYTKMWHSTPMDTTGRAVVFPTAVSAKVTEQAFSPVNRTVIDIDGDTFICGDSAILEGRGGLIKATSDGFVGSAAYCAVLAQCCIMAGKADVLVMGLPPGMYGRKFADETIGRLREKKMCITQGATRTDIQLPGIIQYIPQGSGIFFDHIRNGHDGDYDRNVVVVDIGTYTMDMVFFVEGRYVDHSAHSLPLGVHEIYQRIKDEFYQQHQAWLKSDKAVERLLYDGTVTIAGVSYELPTDSITTAYNAQIASNIEEYVSNLPVEADIIVGGGGGMKFLMKDTLKYPITIVSMSHMSNARGYFEYGKCLKHC